MGTRRVAPQMQPHPIGEEESGSVPGDLATVLSFSCRTMHARRHDAIEPKVSLSSLLHRIRRRKKPWSLFYPMSTGQSHLALGTKNLRSVQDDHWRICKNARYGSSYMWGPSFYDSKQAGFPWLCCSSFGYHAPHVGHSLGLQQSCYFLLNLYLLVYGNRFSA